jgi:autotransporter-associated beta strand protein
VALSANITGSGSLNLLGVGNTTLNGTNTYTGNTTLGSGSSLRVGNVDALSGTTLVHGSNATVQFILPGANTYNLGGLAGTSALAFGTNTLSIGANNETTSFSGTLSGNGSLNKVGNGTLSLAGSNTYNGTTSINAGTLQIGNASGFGSGGNITFGGGILQYGSNITSDPSLPHKKQRLRHRDRYQWKRCDLLKFDQFHQHWRAYQAGQWHALPHGLNNTYTGGTFIESGTLTGSSTGLQGSITNNATLELLVEFL